MSAYTDLPGRTFTGRYLHDAENLTDAVFQAMGAASAHYEPTTQVATFVPAEHAAAVGQELLDYIHMHYAPRERPLT